jgi:bacterioferritin
MKEKSIELLNGVVADELSAIHQYMYFHFHCDDQGCDRFGEKYLLLQSIERSKAISAGGEG